MGAPVRTIRKDMTKGPILSHVLRMAIPMIIGIGSIISFTIVDTYFISLLGGDELAAIGFTAPVTTFLFNVTFGFAIAMSAVISRVSGAKQTDQIRHTISVGIALTIGVTATVGLIGYLFLDPIFRGLGASDDILILVREYMPLWFVSSVFLAVPMVANAAMRGVGNAFWPSVVMVSFAIINAILDPMFIFGYGIIPAFGIKGAAIASVFAASIACLMAFYILAIRENLLSLKCLLEKSVWGKASRTLLVIAIPVSLGSLILPIVSYIYTGFLADIGNTAVAAFGVVTRLEAFILIPIMAIAGGMAPLIGQNYGAGAYDRILKALSQASVFIACYAIISGVVAFIAATYLANIFSNSHETGIFIRDYMMIVPLSYIGLYFFAMLGSVLNALNRAKEGLYLMIIRSFAIAVPIAAYLTHTHGENGFLWSIVITNGLALLMAVAYLQSIRCALRSKSLS